MLENIKIIYQLFYATPCKKIALQKLHDRIGKQKHSSKFQVAFLASIFRLKNEKFEDLFRFLWT